MRIFRWIVMLVVHDWWAFSVEFAKFGAVGLAFTWNFMSRKYLLFRAEKPQNEMGATVAVGQR